MKGRLMGVRTCYTCQQQKPIEDFRRRKNRPLGRGYQCAACAREQVYAWKNKNPIKRRAQQARRRKKHPDKFRDAMRRWRANNPHSSVRNNHGISVAQYLTLVTAQAGKCAICGTDKPAGRGKKLCVDHCHATNKIRGLLCHTCNSGLGFVERFQRHSLMPVVLAYLSRTSR